MEEMNAIKTQSTESHKRNKIIQQHKNETDTTVRAHSSLPTSALKLTFKGDVQCAA